MSYSLHLIFTACQHLSYRDTSMLFQRVVVAVTSVVLTLCSLSYFVTTCQCLFFV
nr:MAG TPA: hypothetical protein [Caudoviricetes sp.]